MNTLIKIGLAIMLLICLFKLPYGYYEVVRFSALIGFGFLAYTANKVNNKTEAIICLVLAILFQPLMKIALGRLLWNIVDVFVAVGLIISLFKKGEKYHGN